MGRNVDYLIVGQGLAGATVARLLLLRGKSVAVADREDPCAASRVAAGLVNPVTGMKLVKTREAERFLPEAMRFYREWEAELGGRRFYHERAVWRFFASEREAALWRVKRETGELAPFARELPEEARTFGADGFAVEGAAYLDTGGLLGSFRAELREREALREEAIDWSEIRVETDGVVWPGGRAGTVIFCEGHRASRNPWFSWLPFRHAKGEVLTVSGPPLREDVVLNRGKWLLPIGPGRYRAGATYGWDDLSETPTEAGRAEILAGIRGLTPWTAVVEEHQAGIRPILRDTYPVVGRHPSAPRVAILNGLGSKGVLWAPTFARQLVEHLEEGGPIDAAADVQRNL